MKFYTRQHQHYCGIDLHARQMYLCILDAAGKVCFSRNLECSPEAFLAAVRPFRDDLVVAVECMFAWVTGWPMCVSARASPSCSGTPCTWGRSTGARPRTTRSTPTRSPGWCAAGMLAQAYVYPPQMRATRDLLRRRCHLVNRRAELITHIQNTISQYNLPPFEGKIGKRGAREGLLAHFPDPQVRNSIALDLAMIEQYDALLPKLERHIRACAKAHDRKAFTLLRSIHGADLIIPLVILYEICTIGRFPRVQDFLSYCRLVKPGRESNGKLLGHAGGKIGNAHLKWIFGELATTPLTRQPPGPAAA